MPVILSPFQPGTTPIHRLPAWCACLLLTVATLSMAIVQAWWSVGVVAAAVACGYILARIRPRTAWRYFRPLLAVIALFGLFMWWATSAETALLFTARLAVTLLAANLLTFTQSVAAITDVVVSLARPLAVFGLNPRTFGLAVGLVIRCIPLIYQRISEIRLAQRSRGARRGALYFGPLLVGIVATADHMGEAIDARGGL